MILYLDSSALIKLLVIEPGRQSVLDLLRQSPHATSSRITYAEVRAALARLAREKMLSGAMLRDAVIDLDLHWLEIQIVEVSDAVVRNAGSLAEEHPLRGYDSVQLASALTVAARRRDLVFASFDKRLVAAAAREHLRVMDSQ